MGRVRMLEMPTYMRRGLCRFVDGPIPKLASFGCVLTSQIDWYILAQLPPTHFFGETATFERPILEVAARGNQFGAKDAVRLGAELAARNGLASENREATAVAVVQNFHQLGFLIREAEV